MEVSFAQPRKASQPIVARAEGRASSVSERQSLKAHVPMLVTVAGRIISVREQHPAG